MLSRLSAELIQSIALYLSPRTIRALTQMNKRIYHLLNNDLFWLKKYRHDYNFPPLVWSTEIGRCAYAYQYALNYAWSSLYYCGQRLLQEVIRIIDQTQCTRSLDLRDFDPTLVTIQKFSIRAELSFIDRSRPFCVRKMKDHRLQVVAPIDVTILISTSNNRFYIVINEDNSVSVESVGEKYEYVGHRRCLRIARLGNLTKYIALVLRQGYWPIKSYSYLDSETSVRYASCIHTLY